MNTKELGILGEKMVCEYLVSKGYRIMCVNYRINFGEIDVVAQKKQKLLGKQDKTIHFVEVKNSRSFYPELGSEFVAGQSIGCQDREKLKKLAEAWLLQNKLSEFTPYQIDIASVCVESKKIEYLENIIAQA